MEFWLLIALGAYLLSNRLKQFQGPAGMEPILKPISSWGPLFGATMPYDPASTAESTIGSNGLAGGPADPLSTAAGAEQSITKQYSTAFLDPGNAPMYPARPSGTGPVQPGGYPMTYPERDALPNDLIYVPDFLWWEGQPVLVAGPAGSQAVDPTQPPRPASVPEDWVWSYSGWSGTYTWMPPGSMT